MKTVSDGLVRIIEAQTKVHHSYSGRGMCGEMCRTVRLMATTLILIRRVLVMSFARNKKHWRQEIRLRYC